MKEIPECLKRRYKALDELVSDLTSGSVSDHSGSCNSTEEPGVRLMCEFWNILKEHPDLNLTKAVQQRMDVDSESFTLPQEFACYMASGTDKKQLSSNKAKRTCCASSGSSQTKSKTLSPNQTPSFSTSYENRTPLNKVLCNLRDATSFDAKCSEKISELQSTQKYLQDQIIHLEHKEKEGTELLKQADTMWTTMEETYKKKIAESLQRQNELMKQLKEAEKSNAKWRKNRKDVTFEIERISKCHQEIMENIDRKTNDMKCMDLEIENLKKRIDSNKKDLEGSSTLISNKQKISAAKLASIAAEITKLEEALSEQQKGKEEKKYEGNEFIKEAREDLQNLSKVLLQKKIENEDLKAERDLLLADINMFKETSSQCHEKGKEKEKSIMEEIKAITKEIKEFKVRCQQCHESTDTVDVRTLCTDCPRCIGERNCVYDGENCHPNTALDCVCLEVKEKFLDNVLENMYTVLERHIRTEPGKTIADLVLNCLKRSRNGKLDNETRKILQDFILITIKKHLNLTIIGGAVKTRCEMDQETYNQLLLCLKKVKVSKLPKVDKGTDAKKKPCPRWGGASECNCPKGPGGCQCKKRVPGTTCDPQFNDNQQEVDEASAVACPHMESTPCGPDCAMHGATNAVGAEISSWKPDPCQGPTCQMRNMRAAQCILGPDVLSSFSNSLRIDPKTSLNASALNNQITCDCGSMPMVSCDCRKESEQLKAKITNNYSKETYTSIGEDKYTDLFSKTNLNEKKIDDASKPYDKDAISKNNYYKYDAKKEKDYIKDTVEKLHKNISSIPIISKTPSGNITIAIDKKIFESIKKLNKGTPLVQDHIKYNKKSEISGNNKSTITSTPSDSLLLKTDNGLINDTKDRRTVDTNTNVCLINSESNKIQHQNIDFNKKEMEKIKVEFQDETGNNISGYLFKNPSGNWAIYVGDESDNKYEHDIENNIGATAKKSESKFGINISDTSSRQNIFSSQEFYPLEMRGFDCPYIESMVVIRRTKLGEYEVVINKEFEKPFKDTVKNYKLSNEIESFQVYKDDCGHYIINLDLKDNVSKSHNIVLVKTSSGNIKVLVEKHNSSELKDVNSDPKRNSIISVNDFKELLTKMKPTDNKNTQEKQKNLMAKSISDSKLYLGKCKNNACTLLVRGVKSKNTQNEGNLSDNEQISKGTIIRDDKSISTTCNAQPDGVSCDISQCTCKFINYDPQSRFDVMKLNKECSNQDQHQHIHYLTLEGNKKEYKEYYDYYDVKKISKRSSNNIDLSELCSACKIEAYGNFCDKSNNLWNSLDYLPPQLPPFLKSYVINT